MSKKITYCEWCGGVTTNPSSLSSKIPILENLEEIIDQYGRDRIMDDYYSGFDLRIKDPQKEASILAYLDLLSNIKFRVICGTCLDKDDELDMKYYDLDEIEIFDEDYE